MSGIHKIFTTIAAVLCAALILPVQSVSAHFLDSDLVLNDVPVGPYVLSVWTVANVLNETSMHISSRLTDPVTGGPVLAANVRYVIRDLQNIQVEIICDAAPASPLNGFLFEGDVPLQDYGSYRVTVEVLDGQGLGGKAAYDYPVFPISAWMQGLVAVLLVIGLVATGWLIKEGYLIFFKKRNTS